VLAARNEPGQMDLKINLCHSNQLTDFPPASCIRSKAFMIADKILRATTISQTSLLDQILHRNNLISSDLPVRRRRKGNHLYNLANEESASSFSQSLSNCFAFKQVHNQFMKGISPSPRIRVRISPAACEFYPRSRNLLFRSSPILNPCSLRTCKSLPFF